jgi:hypothetical protein
MVLGIHPQGSKMLATLSTGANKQVLEVPLESIFGVHPEIEALERELAFPPCQSPAFDMLSDHALNRFATLYPITVVKQKPRKNDSLDTSYLCVGNVRLFMWLKAYWGPKRVITVIVSPWLAPDVVREYRLIELLLTPPLLGVPPKSLRLMAASWSKANEQRQLDKLLAKSDNKGFASLFGVDHRILKKNHDATNNHA